jgi:hypothetical protein
MPGTAILVLAGGNATGKIAIIAKIAGIAKIWPGQQLLN